MAIAYAIASTLRNRRRRSSTVLELSHTTVTMSRAIFGAKRDRSTTFRVARRLSYIIGRRYAILATFLPANQSATPLFAACPSGFWRQKLFAVRGIRPCTRNNGLCAADGHFHQPVNGSNGAHTVSWSSCYVKSSRSRSNCPTTNVRSHTHKHIK